MIKVDLGIFAHNEAAGIAQMLGFVQAQRLPDGVDLRILVLANGCRDDTAAQARAAGAEVAELAEGGKSRTWNRFTRGLARRDAQILIFADADIEMLERDVLARLIQGLCARPELWVLSSQPVKDTALRGAKTLVEKLALKASGGLDDWRTAICGQLYAMPAARARRFRLPIGLPVEDGYLRAMVLTDNLTAPEDVFRIDGAEGVRHIYASERSLGALIRHQERIVIGSAVNAALFAHLTEASKPRAEARLLASDPQALGRVLAARLPRFPQGYVPLHFLVKRLARASLKRLPIAVIGFGFDLIVYIKAQIRMMRGGGAGFW
ncbi:glycosyltransferase family A protein [Xinfangfangia sp. CPCC 101601]|uniref:Glycosyltransferase family A protein n=1 Tax=Pseudogemmobacter lacusdianii TaxID=3069608 RepID=A0ABU0VWX7_9RHOB|nr:glycosyltransferase family A protein [Xinfangfangia sp. CPCC 101601]MDQ2066228.1 glycosyltransferase family A protein [Xinfangfangia sp. CPCC 101601]